MNKKLKILFFISIYILFPSKTLKSEETKINELLDIIQKDLRTLERAVYSESFSNNSKVSTKSNLNRDEKEEILTRHLLKLSEIEKQFQELTNKFEEINFKLDKLNSRFSKTQSDNQLRFQQLENNRLNLNETVTDLNITSKITEEKSKKILPGSSKPQDLGTVSYKDMTSENENQALQSVDTTKTVLSEIIVNEEKILPDVSIEEQYEFATSFLKVGDYNMAERAFKEFVDINPDHNLSGNAQYW